MRFWFGNQTVPMWLRASMLLLRPDTHQQLASQRGYLNNTTLALDHVSHRLFHFQHPPAIDRQHSQPIYRNQLISPLALFTSVVMLHSFIGQSAPSARHVRRELLRRFDLDPFRQQLLVMHFKLANHFRVQLKQFNRSLCIHSLARLSSDLPLNQTFLNTFQTSFEPLLHVDVCNSTVKVKQSNWFSKQASQSSTGLCSAFIRNNVKHLNHLNEGKFVTHQWIQMQDQWIEPFNPLYTHRRVFHNLDGSQSNILFMERKAYQQLITPEHLSGVHLFRLPYTSNEYALYLFGGSDRQGHAATDLHEQMRSLTASTWRQMLEQAAQSAPIYSHIRLPRFYLQFDSISMHEWLPTVAQITHPFNCDYVNFRSLLNRSRALCLFYWTHQASFSIDELGSGHSEYSELAGFYGDQHQNDSQLIKQVDFDRPFVFLIRNEILHVNVLIGSINRL